MTIREFVNDSRTGYKGFTKAGTRIPADKFLEFREAINSIKLEDLKAPEGNSETSEASEGEEAKTSKPKAKAQKSLEENPDY